MSKDDKLIQALREVHQEFQEKHLPGKHDQKSHGGEKGAGSGASNSKQSIPLGGSSKPLPQGYSIKFDEVPGYHKLSDFTDAAIQAKSAKLEKAVGRKLSKDSRTGFPTFTVYEDGEEVGGG